MAASILRQIKQSTSMTLTTVSWNSNKSSCSGHQNWKRSRGISWHVMPLFYHRIEVWFWLGMSEYPLRAVFHGKGWLCNTTEWRCTATLASLSQRRLMKHRNTRFQSFHAICSNCTASTSALNKSERSMFMEPKSYVFIEVLRSLFKIFIDKRRDDAFCFFWCTRWKPTDWQIRIFVGFQESRKLFSFKKILTLIPLQTLLPSVYILATTHNSLYIRHLVKRQYFSSNTPPIVLFVGFIFHGVSIHHKRTTPIEGESYRAFSESDL